MVSNRRALAGNTVWSLSNELAGLASSAVTVVLLIPRLGPAGFGTYVGLYAMVGPFTAFAQSGLPLTMMQSTVRDQQNGRAVVGSCTSLALLSSLALFPIVVLLGLRSFSTLSLITILVFVVAEMFVQSELLLIATSVRCLRTYGAGTAFQLMLQLLRLAVTVTLALTGYLSLSRLVTVNAVVFGTVLVVVLTFSNRLQVGSLRPGAMHMGHLAAASLFGVGIASSVAQSDGDKVFLNASGYRADAGLYGAAYRFISLVMVPISAFITATHFAALRSARATSSQLRLAYRYSAISLIYSVPASAASVLLARFVPKLLGSEFEGTVLMLQLLTPVVVMRSVGTFFANGLLGLNRNGLRTGVLIAAALVSLGLYAALIPEYSWRGAVVATLISETFGATAMWIALASAQRRADAAPPSNSPVPELAAEG